MTPTRWIGWLLALVTVVTVVRAQQDVGIARDETVYMTYGSKYAAWWSGLVTFQHGVSAEGITKTFGGKAPTENNREHPPLMKMLFGFSEKLLHDKLGIASEVTAYRFPSALMHGLLVALIYFFVLGIAGLPEAVIAALLALLLPRALFHAGLACFDAPIMTLWFATIYAYWRALAKSTFPWEVGVIFGLALATKHNAMLLPFALGVHYLVLGINAAVTAKDWKLVITHRWTVIASLSLLGPLTLYALWPWLWFAPFSHVAQWLKFHLTHVHYNFEYLGRNWNAPPFPAGVAVVTTLYTVPVATLVAALAGLGAWTEQLVKQRKGRDSGGDPTRPVLLLLLSAAVSMGPFFLGSTPIFGAEKHWMPALPTIVIAAGVGIVWCARRLLLLVRRELGARAEQVAIASLASLVVIAAAVETRAAHPYALTWYNALAGGAPGGADHGMNRQFWGVAARGVLAELPKLLPGGGPVYTHDASPAWGMYQRAGLVPRSMPDAGWEELGIQRSELALVIHEKHFNRHDFLIWKSYGTVAPVFVLRADGVPIVSVYRRPRRPGLPPAKP